MQSKLSRVAPFSPGPPPLAATTASIVCGTDFSESAMQSVDVAAALAKRLGEPLVLAHAVDDQPRQNLPGELRESLSLYARGQLHAERERLRAAQGELVEAFRAGAPAEVLLEEVAARHARLLVLTSTKRRSLAHWLRGHVIERVTDACEIPTLIVRNPSPLLRWACGERKLRIFVAADFSTPSEAALRWVDWAQNIGPCQVVVSCLEPRPAFPRALDLHTSVLMDDFALKAGLMQERNFKHWVRTLLPKLHRVRVRFEPNWGGSDAHLIQLATAERADLIVVGTRAPHAWHFIGQHSVSRGVLHYAPLNVVCVPARPEGAVPIHCS